MGNCPTKPCPKQGMSSGFVLLACFSFPLPLIALTTVVDWPQWENKSPKQAWRESCRVWCEIKDVRHCSLSEDTESLKCLQGAEKDSFKTCPPDPYSQRAPKERDLLGLECLARLLCLLNTTGSMESICCVWPHFPLGFMAQKPEYSSWAYKSNLDTLCPAGTPESVDFSRNTSLLCWQADELVPAGRELFSWTVAVPGTDFMVCFTSTHKNWC